MLLQREFIAPNVRPTIQAMRSKPPRATRPQLSPPTTSRTAARMSSFFTIGSFLYSVCTGKVPIPERGVKYLSRLCTVGGMEAAAGQFRIGELARRAGVAPE